MTPINKWLLFTFIFLPIYAISQEQEYPLRYNAEAALAYSGKNEQRASYKRRLDTVLNLPFIEDFSASYYFPDQKKWRDNDVFVNANFSVLAPSIGVATFDGLNAHGYPYNDLGRNQPKYCDNLTSQYINLSKIEDKDSLYLSFFFQAKGLGDNPESTDSLILEFKQKSSTANWRRVWSTHGGADTIDIPEFKEVRILLVDSPNISYFHDSFQFRFKNYGNPTGALDHWHVDYIILDTGRTMDEKVREDFCLYKKPRGLLRTYRSMPWKQFLPVENNYLSDNLDFYYYNSSDFVRRPRPEFEIFDVTNNLFLDSQKQNSNPEYAEFERKAWPVKINLNTAKVRKNTEDLQIRVQMVTTTLGGADLIPTNHQFKFIQHFGNYFAYDDGSAEGGYGIQDTRSGSVALRFELVIPDTLRYIAFHFTSAREPIAQPQKLNFVIWKKLFPKGQEEEITRLQGATPKYTKVMNGFAIYELSEPIPLSGEFYIGWEQFKDYNFNVGFDKNYGDFTNNEPNPNLFYNTSGGWTASSVVGTPMIRPIFGKEYNVNIDHTGKNIESIPTVYPNPFSTSLTLNSNCSSNETNCQEVLNIQIFNAQGKQIFSQTLADQKTLNTSGWKSGIYIINIQLQNGKSFSKKLIKQ